MKSITRIYVELNENNYTKGFHILKINHVEGMLHSKSPENQVFNSQKVSTQVLAKMKSPKKLWDSHTLHKAAISWEKPRNGFG